MVFIFIYLEKCLPQKVWLTTFLFFKLEFTPCKAEQPVRGMELQEKEAQKRSQYTGKMFRKKLKDVC